MATPPERSGPVYSSAPEEAERSSLIPHDQTGTNDDEDLRNDVVARRLVSVGLLHRHSTSIWITMTAARESYHVPFHCPRLRMGTEPRAPPPRSGDTVVVRSAAARSTTESGLPLSRPPALRRCRKFRHLPADAGGLGIPEDKTPPLMAGPCHIVRAVYLFARPSPIFSVEACSTGVAICEACCPRWLGLRRPQGGTVLERASAVAIFGLSAAMPRDDVDELRPVTAGTPLAR